MKDNRDFTAIFKDWFGERTLTQAASELDIGITTAHSYLHGTARPRRRAALRMGRVMGVESDAILAALEAAPAPNEPAEESIPPTSSEAVA